jgi:RNA polymerase sigma-70 factor (ECF subfamily)
MSTVRSTSEFPDRARERAFLDATLPHLDALHAIARQLARDPHRAEDLVQETYLRAFASFDSHYGVHTKAWLATICLNLSRDHGRRRARRVVEEVLPETLEVPTGDRGVVDEVIARVDQAAVSLALEQLPKDQRIAIILMDLAGHSAQEASEILDCPRNTVLSRVHRGRRRLAQVLELEGVERGMP